MNESEFHTLADHCLTRIADALEEAAGNIPIEVECQNGILSVVLPDKTLLVNKHAPSRQIWLASPISGGLHFSYDAAGGQWALADGRTLGQVLSQDLKSLANLDIKL